MKKLGIWPFVLLFAGALCVLFTIWNLDPISSAPDVPSWTAYCVGLVLFLAGTVIFYLKAKQLEPSWKLVAVAAVITLIFGVGIYLWLIPARNEPVIFHPAIGLQLINFAWLVILIKMAIQNVNKPLSR